jgi:hypothetical protein
VLDKGDSFDFHMDVHAVHEWPADALLIPFHKCRRTGAFMAVIPIPAAGAELLAMYPFVSTTS